MYRLKILRHADQAFVFASVLISPDLSWATQGRAGSIWKPADEGFPDAGGGRIDPSAPCSLFARPHRQSALASAIHGPSYVSFESALAWHGLIPERVEEVVCAALKRPPEFESPVCRYRYRHVTVRVFSIGVERVEDPLLPWLLASPTKALCDSIALDASIRSQKAGAHAPSGPRLRSSQPIRRQAPCGALPELEEPRQGPGFIRPRLVCRPQRSAKSRRSVSLDAAVRGSAA